MYYLSTTYIKLCNIVEELVKDNAMNQTGHKKERKKSFDCFQYIVHLLTIKIKNNFHYKGSFHIEKALLNMAKDSL